MSTSGEDAGRVLTQTGCGLMSLGCLMTILAPVLFVVAVLVAGLFVN